MYIKKTCGYVFQSLPVPLSEKGWLDFYTPTTHQSSTWKYWKATLDPKLCPACLAQHGKIYAKGEIPDVEPPLHDRCRCDILPMEAITPGGATKDGVNGADYWLAMYGSLPDYYITKAELYTLGWKNGRSVASKAPGKMVFGGIYGNDDGHLPSAPGRIWYEADINYYEGRRNRHRILFSTDGLIFVTYDHYRTFFEVDLGG